MKHYVIDYDIKESKYGNEYYEVILVSDEFEQHKTYVYPMLPNGKKMHNAQDWIDVIKSKHGIVLDGLKFKDEKKGIINADSLKNCSGSYYETRDEMFDDLMNKMNTPEPTNNNGLFDFG